MPDVWYCPEHGCELVRDSGGGWFCPDGEHTASDAVLAVWQDVADVAAELAEAWDYLRSRAS